MDSQRILHDLPLWVSYGVYFLSILGRNYCDKRLQLYMYTCRMWDCCVEVNPRSFMASCVANQFCGSTPAKIREKYFLTQTVKLLYGDSVVFQMTDMFIATRIYSIDMNHPLKKMKDAGNHKTSWNWHIEAGTRWLPLWQTLSNTNSSMKMLEFW